MSVVLGVVLGFTAVVLAHRPASGGDQRQAKKIYRVLLLRQRGERREGAGDRRRHRGEQCVAERAG